MVRCNNQLLRLYSSIRPDEIARPWWSMRVREGWGTANRSRLSLWRNAWIPIIEKPWARVSRLGHIAGGRNAVIPFPAFRRFHVI